MGFFAHEPTIQELQRIAMRYAEVEPEKILEWRRSAQVKAWVPEVSLSRDWSEDPNIDIDRGGTGDPDRYISGPEEESKDFTVSLEWDLGELVWNPDQTSIDTRSKLMVELREDLMNQLNHLYFARRRLQIERILLDPESTGLDWERQLQIQEFTAGIDALTGGYFSRRLGETADQGGARTDGQETKISVPARPGSNS